MNNYWSAYVQSSEELYQSRALRFREDNADLWLSALARTCWRSAAQEVSSATGLKAASSNSGS